MIMKKILMIVGMITLTLTSCTNDVATDSNANIAKTDVLANVQTTSTNSATGKNVNRGSIYAWVKDINVTATSTVWNYVTNESFTLVGSGGASNFIIKDVAVGANKFDAVTTTFDANKVYAKNSINPTGSATAVSTAQSAINTMKGHNPYAIYNGTTNKTIVNAAVNTIDINMTTNHGRIISAFILANDAVLKANTYAIVTAKIDGMSNTTLTSEQIKNNVVTFEWSNENAIVGKSIVYTITVYDDTNPNKALKTYTITKEIMASTSYSCIYTIDRDKIINSEEDKLVFTFQIWNEVDCADIYEDDGYNCNGYDKEGHYNKDHDKNHKD